MKRELVIFLVGFGFASPALAACEDAENQAAQAGCLGAEYEAVDAELNRTYEAAMGYLVETPSQDLLIGAQRKWIAFRDAACEAEASVWEGGSIQPIVQVTCLIRITEARTDDLAAILQGEY